MYRCVVMCVFYDKYLGDIIFSALGVIEGFTFGV